MHPQTRTAEVLRPVDMLAGAPTRWPISDADVNFNGP